MVWASHLKIRSLESSCSLNLGYLTRRLSGALSIRAVTLQLHLSGPLVGMFDFLLHRGQMILSSGYSASYITVTRDEEGNPAPLCDPSKYFTSRSLKIVQMLCSRAVANTMLLEYFCLNFNCLRRHLNWFFHLPTVFSTKKRVELCTKLCHCWAAVPSLQAIWSSNADHCLHIRHGWFQSRKTKRKTKLDAIKIASPRISAWLSRPSRAAIS